MREISHTIPRLPFNIQYQGKFVRISTPNRRKNGSSYLHSSHTQIKKGNPMFLSSLSHTQKKIFLGLAKEILIADDAKIDHAEETYLRGLCSEMSLSYNDEQSVNKSELTTFFPETEARRVVLLELVALGYSNHHYHKSQDQYTDDMTNILDIPIKELRAMEQLVHEHIVIRDKFVNIIEANNDRGE